MGKKSSPKKEQGGAKSEDSGMDAFAMMSGMVEEDTYKVTLMNELGGGQLTVEFTLPDGKTAVKDLPVAHKELRRGGSAPKGKPIEAEDYKVGAEVKVWSRSCKAWCKGSIVSVRGATDTATKAPETPKAAPPKDNDDCFAMMAGMAGEEIYKVNLTKEVGGPHVTVQFKLPDGTDAKKELPSAHQELQAIWAVGDAAEVWSNQHNAWCKGKVISYRPAKQPLPSGTMEMKVSRKNNPRFYIRSAESFLKGVEAKEATDGKKAVDAKPPVEVLIISGTGEAINTAIVAATTCETNRLGSITKVETAYPQLTEGHGCAQITIHVTRKP